PDQMPTDPSLADPDAIEPDLDPRIDPCVYLTHAISPVGGVIKQRPEDFFVEELPAYEPCGSGEHIYLFIEKRNISTMHAVQAVARHFNVRIGDVGYAGLKDKFAVTRQLLSVYTPGKKPADFPAFEHERIGLLWCDQHTNKLRQGHLAGNRFVIRIRNTDLTKVVHAHRALSLLEKIGVPNRIGEQRFGNLANNHLIGRALLLRDHQTVADLLLGPSQRFPEMQTEARALYAAGKYDESWAAFSRNADTERRVLHALAKGKPARHAIYAMGNMPMRFYITAFQSAVFNAVLDARLAEGAVGSLKDGDLAWKHENGAVFKVDEAVLEDPTTPQRLAALNISPSGPMWGLEMMQPSGETARMEQAALDATGVTLDALTDFAKKLSDPVPGKRRPLRIPLAYPDAEGGTDEHGHYVRVVFELPAGSFATVVLRELMKPELAAK
ncbi:MAG: tRNA pseudouridine(13) synthase TruD, partial [Pyrinomonadaceae bacterium]|nr:tRNA pseudouridine(13) synthase TruD [Phycisphaerales bacterium]